MGGRLMNNNYGWVFWKQLSPRAKFADDSKLAGTTKLETLVRELIQNAVDARVQNPARLVVKDGQVNLEAVWEPLKLQGLKEHIQGTLDFAETESPGNRVIPKCQGQLALLNSGHCRYLKFSDFGTRGLDGVEGFDKTKALWRLMLDDGTSVKKSSSAGGVGVGKNATFPFSRISTVLYATRTDVGYGLVGTAKLNTSKINGVTYEQEGNLFVYDDYEQIISSGSYQGVRALDESVLDSLDKTLFGREENGTDVIILGTDGNAALSESEWGKKFAAYAIKNFLPAIQNGIFTLTVEQTGREPIEIDSDTLKAVIEELSDDENEDVLGLDEIVHEAQLTLATLEGAAEDENFVVKKHKDDVLGDFTLYMNASPDVDQKRWHLFRSFGMRTVTRQPRMQRPVFGIVTIDSKEGSDYLLAAESGNHTEYDYQPLGDRAKEVQNAIEAFQNWVAQEIGAFARVDSTATDIELAGLTSFIAMPEDLKTSDIEGGVKPALELEVPPAPKKAKKRKPRKRDSAHADPEGQIQGQRKEQWNHNEDSHKEWGGQRDTKAVDTSLSEGGSKAAYERTVQVKATFRDKHLPFSSSVELIGRVANQVYKGKKIDISIAAVNEQGRVNDYLPQISKVTDLLTGEVLASNIQGHTIKDVPVSRGLAVHLEIEFNAPFRSSLIENASVIQRIDNNQTVVEE